MRKKFISLMLALALCLGLAVPVSAAGFSDVPASHWAYEQINQAVADGIVGGYADGTFKPAAPVSYAAFSLMLARAFYSGELAADVGSVIYGEEAVELGLIDEIGGLSAALERLHGMIDERKNK